MSLRISLLHQFERQEDETYDICFSPDGNTLWSSDGRAVYQWQRGSGNTWNYYQRFPGRTLDLQCTPDGKMVVFWDGEKRGIRFLSFEGKELMTLSHPDQGIVVDFAISPDQRWLVRDGKNGNILLYDLLKHQWSSISVPDQPDTADGTTGCFRFALNGLIFCTSNSEGHVHVCHFDPEHDHYAIRRILPIFGIEDMKVSPDGKLLALASVGGLGSMRGVYVYDLESLQLLQKFPEPVDTSYGMLAFSPDGRFLMSSREDGFIDIWSLATFEHVASFEAHKGPTSDMRHWSGTIGGLNWSTTGYIATGGTGIWRDDMVKEDLSIRIWKVEDE